MDAFLSSQNSLFASPSPNTNAAMNDLFDEYLGQPESPSKPVNQNLDIPDGDFSKVKENVPGLNETVANPTTTETPPPQDPQPSSLETTVTPSALSAQQPQAASSYGHLYDPSTMMNYSVQQGQQQYPHYQMPMSSHMMMMNPYQQEQGSYYPPPEQYYDFGWPQHMMSPAHMGYYPPQYHAGASPYARPARGRGSRGGGTFGPKPRRARGRKAANGGDRPAPNTAGTASVTSTPAPYQMQYNIYHEMPEAQAYLHNVHISPRHNFMDINIDGMGTSLDGTSSTDLKSLAYSQVTPNHAQMIQAAPSHVQMMQQQPPKEH